MTKASLRQRFLLTSDTVVSHIPPRLLRLPRNDAGAYLSPLLQGLRYLRRLGGSITSPLMLREKFRQEMLSIQVGFPVREVKELQILGSETDIPARLYRPQVSDELPVLLVYVHGGGFVFGDLNTHDDACRLLCQESGMPVLSVAYRLAPEHPFPAALDDVAAAIRWALAHQEQFGVKAVAIGGDSAGANLAAVSVQSIENCKLLAQLLIYPSTDQTTIRPSHRLFSKGFFLNQTDRDLFYQCYLGEHPDLASDPRVSPLLNLQRHALPPALIVTAGFDMLRDEGEAYVSHLQSRNSQVKLIRFNHLGHGFINLAGIHADSREAVRSIAKQWRLLCKKLLSQK